MPEPASVIHFDQDVETEEWKQALVVGVLVARAGGRVAIPIEEIVRLAGTTVTVYVDSPNQQIVVQSGVDTRV